MEQRKIKKWNDGAIEGIKMCWDNLYIANSETKQTRRKNGINGEGTMFGNLLEK
jgi:hypothetical protein